MQENIVIDLVNKINLVDKYNENKISKDLIEYLITEMSYIRKREKVKIIVNKKCEIEQNCKEMIQEGLKQEYKRSIRRHHIRNVKQIALFLLGILLIFLSTLIPEKFIWKEIVLISGWVPIWEMVELELFSDAQARKRRFFIRKLLKCEIIEKDCAIIKY